jgi:hypothetical protein
LTHFKRCAYDGDSCRRSIPLDEKLKGLIKELGEAINLALSQSGEISEAIQNVRDAGYDVYLVLEATIGFNKRAAAENAGQQPVEASDGKLRVTSQDLKFLRSLKISVEDLNER